MITYKAIIQYFDAISERHQQIESFTYGEVNFFDKDKFTMYPALHLTPTGTAIDDQTIVYGFDVVVFDRYDVASNKMKNEANCLSDSLLILQDICKEITEGKYFINEDTNISMNLPVVCQPFIDTEPDNCSGWTTSFNVITPNEASACSIPYFNPEIWNGSVVTLPSGSPSEYAWYSIMDMQNIFTFSGQEVSSMATFQDNISGSDTLTLTGESLTFDLLKNALRFRDSSPTGECYLEHPGLPSDNTWTFFMKIKDFSRFGHLNLSQGLITFESGGKVVKVGIANINGKLTLNNGTSTAQSEFAICPTNGTDIDTAHRRQQPLTIALTFSPLETWTKLYYTNNILEEMKVATDSMQLGGGSFYIGAKGSPSIYCDFYLEEFFMTPTLMSRADIITTMEWLNYR